MLIVIRSHAVSLMQGDGMLSPPRALEDLWEFSREAVGRFEGQASGQFCRRSGAGGGVGSDNYWRSAIEPAGPSND